VCVSSYILNNKYTQLIFRALVQVENGEKTFLEIEISCSNFINNDPLSTIAMGSLTFSKAFNISKLSKFSKT
jgi:hypothetical protein